VVAPGCGALTLGVDEEQAGGHQQRVPVELVLGVGGPREAAPVAQQPRQDEDQHAHPQSCGDAVQGTVVSRLEVLGSGFHRVTVDESASQN
jgi:hypothetical protein